MIPFNLEQDFFVFLHPEETVCGLSMGSELLASSWCLIKLCLSLFYQIVLKKQVKVVVSKKHHFRLGSN